MHQLSERMGAAVTDQKPAAGPPREYEILIDQHGQPFEMRRIEDEAFANCTYSFDRKIVHVIEKSAYDQLAQELERERKEFERDRERIALAEARVKELEAALEWIADTTRREFGHGMSAVDICYQLRKRARRALGRE